MPSRPRQGRQLSVELPPQLLQDLKEHAAASGRRVTDLVRRWVELGLAGELESGAPAGPSLLQRLTALEIAVEQLNEGFASLDGGWSKPAATPIDLDEQTQDPITVAADGLGVPTEAFSDALREFIDRAKLDPSLMADSLHAEEDDNDPDGDPTSRAAERLGVNRNSFLESLRSLILDDQKYRKFEDEYFDQNKISLPFEFDESILKPLYDGFASQSFEKEYGGKWFLCSHKVKVLATKCGFDQDVLNLLAFQLQVQRPITTKQLIARLGVSRGTMDSNISRAGRTHEGLVLYNWRCVLAMPAPHGSGRSGLWLPAFGDSKQTEEPVA